MEIHQVENISQSEREREFICCNPCGTSRRPKHLDCCSRLEGILLMNPRKYPVHLIAEKYFTSETDGSGLFSFSERRDRLARRPFGAVRIMLFLTAAAAAELPAARLRAVPRGAFADIVFDFRVYFRYLPCARA